MLPSIRGLAFISSRHNEDNLSKHLDSTSHGTKWMIYFLKMPRHGILIYCKGRVDNSQASLKELLICWWRGKLGSVWWCSVDCGVSWQYCQPSPVSDLPRPTSPLRSGRQTAPQHVESSGETLVQQKAQIYNKLPVKIFLAIYVTGYYNTLIVVTTQHADLCLRSFDWMWWWASYHAATI